MKQFLDILKFEFLGYIKNKVFVGITLALIILAGAVLSYPRISQMIKSDQNSSGEENSSGGEIIMICDDTAADGSLTFAMEAGNSLTLTLFTQGMPDKRVELTEKSIDELKNMVESGECFAAVVITSPTDYTYIVNNVGMYDTLKYTIDEIMLSKYRLEEMNRLGLSAEESISLLSTAINSETIQMGKNQMENFFYTYVLIFALYMAILLYGQFVATSVASEKSSRAMELLVTSAKPTNLMFGKVMGSGLSGLLQLSLILGSSFVLFNFNKSYWEGNEIINSIFNMPLSILLYTVLFFVLGYFIYSFLYGAVGSMASKVEDINSSVMPITFLFIIAFFVVMFSMGSGNVDSRLMVICSYIPFTSPMAMFVRIAMGSVKSFEIVISVIILLISTIGIGYISAEIYKVGVLMYGKAPKITDIAKVVRNSK